MSAPWRPVEGEEPERYELSAAPAYRFDFPRRDFLQLFGGGVAVLLVAEPLRAQESGRGGGRDGLPDDVSAWIHVNESGGITAFTGKTEIGQDIRTSLSQAIADELRVGIEGVELVMADTDRTPYDRGTFGSRTTPTMAPQLRRAAAALRGLLIGLAAEKWNVEPAALTVEEGRVRQGSGRSAAFGELTRGQALAHAIPQDATSTAVAEWRLAGQSQPKVNGRAFVTGRHRYTSDLVRRGMWYGKVLRAPSVGASLASADLTAAEALADVTVVRDGDFVGAAAPSPARAAAALDAVAAEWRETPQPSAEELFEYLKSHPDPEGRARKQQHGDVAAALAAAEKTLEGQYTVAYIAHAPLEPRSAVAEWSDGKLTVWTGTQRPFGVRSELAEAFHLAEERVRVIVPDTGSAYGGKHTGECAVEAARLARAAGRPVKLTWTRPEEFRWAYFRPAGVIDIRCGFAADGRLTAWEMHNVNSGSSGIEDRYDVPNRHLEFHPAQSPLRQGSYRGLAATANHFARESQLDDVAHAVGVDPLELRLRNSSDERFLAVLRAAAERFGWAGRERSRGRGYGLAVGFEKGSYVATCAEVSVPPGGKLRVERLVTAFECGAVVNPAGVRAQVEGMVIQGLGGALFEAIDFADGRIRNGHFSRYRLPRLSDVPPLETVILDRKDLPSAGAGETPIVCVAPALGNAIFDAAGKRLRRLPLAPDGVIA